MSVLKTIADVAKVLASVASAANEVFPEKSKSADTGKKNSAKK
jgi:hypothetical protein